MMKRPFKIKELVAFESESDIDHFLQHFEKFSFETDCLGVNDFRFRSYNSFGTGSINNYGHQPISIYGYKKLLDKKWFFVLESRLRFDAALISIFCICMNLVIIYHELFNKTEIPYWVSLCLFPGIVIFFNWVYYIQELSLMNGIRSASESYKSGELCKNCSSFLL